jgi:hypothetical protein
MGLGTGAEIDMLGGGGTGGDSELEPGEIRETSAPAQREANKWARPVGTGAEIDMLGGGGTGGVGSDSSDSELEPGEIRMTSAPAQRQANKAAGARPVGTGAEIDMLVDRYALYHLEECGNWRRFVVCHSVKENVCEAKVLFPTVCPSGLSLRTKRRGANDNPD